MDNPILIVFIWMGKSVRIQRVKWNKISRYRPSQSIVYFPDYIRTKDEVGAQCNRFKLPSNLKVFYWPFQGGASFVDHFWYLCLVFFMLRSVHCCLVVTTWRERADILAVVNDVYCDSVTFQFCILGQVWNLNLSIPDPIRPSYLY